MQADQAVTSLSALAQRSRLAIFRWLVVRGTAGAYPTEIAQQLALPPATLSFHLKTLQQAGLVLAEPSSRFIRYTANFAAIDALLGYLTENCCAGQNADCATPLATCSATATAAPRC